MTPLAEKTLKIAQSQIGVQEIPKGSNAGTDVEKYLKSVGLKKGFSWCMAFVYWCVLEATIQTGAKTKLKKTAGVLDQWNNKPELRMSIPEPGTIFIIDYGKGLGHTGFVLKLLPNGKMQTIEGNTNDEGSREGFEVCTRIRSIDKCKGFLKI